MKKKFAPIITCAVLIILVMTLYPFNSQVIGQNENSERVLTGAIPFEFSLSSEWRNGHGYEEDEFVSLVHAGLYHRSFENGREYIPFLAKDYPEISNNGLTWTVDLRENLYFPNGKHLTAEDVVFTYIVTLTPAINNESGSYFKNSNVLSSNSSIVAVDDFTVQFNFVEITKYQFEILSHTIMEKDDFSDRYDNCVIGVIADCFWSDNLGTFTQNAGPFQVESLSSTEVVVVRNPNYFDSSNLRVDKIIIKSILDTEIALQMLSDGSLDFISEVYPTTKEDVEDLDNIASQLYSQARTETVWINHLHPVFGTGEQIPDGTGLTDNDQEQAKWVRRALSTMMDRQYIIDNFYKGLATVATSTIPESAINHNHDLIDPIYSIELAKEYLENAGYDFDSIIDGNSDGDYGDNTDTTFFNLTFVPVGSTEERHGWTKYYTNELTKIGINAVHMNFTNNISYNIFVQVGELIPLYNNEGYDLLAINFGQFGFEWDSMEFYTSKTLCNTEFSINNNFCGNVLNYDNPLIDNIAEQFDNELNQTLRNEIAYQFQEVMQEDVVELYVFNDAKYVAVDNEVHNFEFSMHEFGFLEWHRLYKTSWPIKTEEEDKSEGSKIPLMLQWLIPAFFILLVVRKRIIFV